MTILIITPWRKKYSTHHYQLQPLQHLPPFMMMIVMCASDIVSVTFSPLTTFSSHVLQRTLTRATRELSPWRMRSTAPWNQSPTTWGGSQVGENKPRQWHWLQTGVPVNPSGNWGRLVIYQWQYCPLFSLLIHWDWSPNSNLTCVRSYTWVVWNVAGTKHMFIWCQTCEDLITHKSMQDIHVGQRWGMLKSIWVYVIS